MNKYSITILSLTGGILLALAWMEGCSGLILLIGFVPFLVIENYLFENRAKYHSNSFFIYLLPGLIIFNILTLGWIRVASIVTALTVILGVSFLMSFTMWLAHIIRLRAGNTAGFISLITLWLTFEFLCLNINLLSPWINLGNGLSKDILFIQWYEVTGVAGGTLWILSSNLFLSIFLINFFRSRKRSWIFILIWFLVITIPSVISITRYLSIRTSDERESEVLIIQPNIDPYKEKFIVPFEDQLRNVLDMASREVTLQTDWIITPETTVDDPVNENAPDQNKYVGMVKELIIQNPGACVVTGMVSYLPDYLSGKDSVNESGSIGFPESYHANFNSAFKIDTGKSIDIYHKSKLVPGIEMRFSKGLDRIISKILPDLGGTKGYGIQNERACFEHSGNRQIIAPVICYESVFGKYVTEYIRKGAEAIFIITNDGWWKNTGGYKQHLSYASLRAIETRRPVARAANTGISCFIDIRGKIIQKTEWWTPATLSGRIVPETRITPYVKYGDYLMIIACVMSILIIMIVFILMPHLRKEGKN